MAAEIPAALARALSPDMLRANVAHFEYGVGPPRNSDGNTHVYPIAGCEVEVTVEEGLIQSITVAIAPPCALDLDAFFPNYARRLPPLNRLTFGDFQSATTRHGRFYADCLMKCGNGYENNTYYFWDGSHADGFREVLLHFNQIDPASETAASRWADAMATGYGIDWVAGGYFNCNVRVQDGLARTAFQDVRPTAITVGYELRVPECPTTPAPAFNSRY
jgi:hypothetical protein